MASAFIIIYSLIFTLALVGAAGYFFFEMFFKRKEAPRDDPIVNNIFMKQYTGGYSQLLAKKIVTGNKRICIHWVPKSIAPLEYYKFKKKRYDVPEFEEKKFWVPKEKLHFYPKGTADDNRNIIVIEPFSADDLPEEMKKTRLGQMWMKICEETNTNMTEKAYIKSQNEKLSGIINSELIGETSVNVLEKIQALFEENLKYLNKSKEIKNTFSHTNA